MLLKRKLHPFMTVEDLESDVHALVAQWNHLRKAVGEKKKLVQELEEAEKQ